MGNLPQQKGPLDVVKDIKAVYGPYIIQNPDSPNFGRKQVIVNYKNKTRRTLLLSRHLMEQHLGRKLGPDETVDHVDRDKTNDVITNLQVLSRSEHNKKDAKRVKKVEFNCVWCGNKGSRQPKELAGCGKKGKAGPFCGKPCAGQYGASIQNNKTTKLPPQPSVVQREYYKV